MAKYCVIDFGIILITIIFIGREKIAILFFSVIGNLRYNNKVAKRAHILDMSFKTEI